MEAVDRQLRRSDDPSEPRALGEDLHRMRRHVALLRLGMLHRLADGVRNVLMQAPAEGDVDDLKSAADAEQRHVVAQRAIHQLHLERVAIARDQRGLGMRVLAEAAWLEAEEQAPDLILTDIHMPEAKGTDICRTLKNEYGTQDIPSVFEDYFGGTPWAKPEVYARSSPLHFIARARTPTLLLHGENDARVPPGQAYEFYRALRRQGVETKMIVYPRTPHGPREPKFLLHIMEQHLEWTAQHLSR